MTPAPITMVEVDRTEPPTPGELLSAVCDVFDATPEEALDWLAKMDRQTAYAQYLCDRGILI